MSLISNIEYNTKIKELILKFPCSYSTMLKHGKQYAYLLEYINMCTLNMPNELPLPTRIFYTLNNIKEHLKCKVCGNDIPYNRKCNALTGYISLCCSRSCAQLDPDYIKRQKERSYAKYGTARPQMAESVKNKMKQTLSQKDKKFWQAAAEKRKNTNRQKYGVDFVSQTTDVKDKIKEIFSNKTQADWDNRYEKSKQTKLKKYGDEKFNNIEKTKQTIQSNIEQDPNFWHKVAAKRKQTFINKYGIDCALKLEKNKDKIKRSHIIKSFNEHILNNENVEPLFDAEYYVQHRFNDLKWKCKICGDEFTAKSGDQMYFPARCLKCHPLHEPVSRPEKELTEFIKSIYSGEIIENNRTILKPNELDVYIPNLNLAFEMNGLLWHSEEMGTLSNYHLSKTERCEAIGIRLIHISEAEWRCKQNLIKSRIKSLFGIYDKKIYARNCTIKLVSSSESKQFQEKNHIQGFSASKINLGLYFNDELISLMTFGKCRFNKKYEWELIRFCSKLNTHIIGGAGKLLSYFEKNYNPSSLISYADRKWSQGNLYLKLDFKLDHKSKPDYKYWNRKRGVYMPESRIKYQKHKLEKLLPNFNPKISESENMKHAGFMKIYDCGNLVFIKKY